MPLLREWAAFLWLHPNPSAHTVHFKSSHASLSHRPFIHTASSTRKFSPCLPSKRIFHHHSSVKAFAIPLRELDALTHRCESTTPSQQLAFFHSTNPFDAIPCAIPLLGYKTHRFTEPTPSDGADRCAVSQHRQAQNTLGHIHGHWLGSWCWEEERRQILDKERE